MSSKEPPNPAGGFSTDVLWVNVMPGPLPVLLLISSVFPADALGIAAPASVVPKLLFPCEKTTAGTGFASG